MYLTCVCSRSLNNEIGVECSSFIYTMSDVWLSALPTPTPLSFKNFETRVIYIVLHCSLIDYFVKFHPTCHPERSKAESKFASVTSKPRCESTAGISNEVLLSFLGESYFYFKIKTTVNLYRSRCCASPYGFDYATLRSG